MATSSQKFDVIHFANHPEEWEEYKKDTRFEDKLKDIAEFLEVHIKENFANFYPPDIFKKDLYFNGSISSLHQGKIQYKFKYEFSALGRKISKEFVFDSSNKSEMYGNMINNDFINFEGKNDQKYKDDFIEIYSFIHYYLGCTKMLISQTDIMVKILGQAKSYKGFKNIKHLKKYKDNFTLYNNEKQKAIGLLDENMGLIKINEEIKKQRGTYNQYFAEWDADTVSMKRSDIRSYYENVFINKHSELKKYSFDKFSANYRKSKSNDLKALRGKK